MKVSEAEQSPETGIAIEPAAKVLGLSHWGLRYRKRLQEYLDS